MKNYLLWIVATSWIYLFTATSLQAQQSAKDMKPVTSTFALTGVNVVSSPGTMMEDVTIIIKDGLIANIGKDLTIPGEAEIIEGDSMYVYAGFISALSHAGIKSEESESRNNRSRSNVDPVNPPNSVAGIMPERMVRDMLDTEEKSIEAMRKAGFTAAQVVPEGGMFPGSGAVVVMAGESADAMILKEGTAMFSQLVGGPRVYPATVIGVMAKWRELYRQAKLAMKHEAAYAAQPNGTVRPNYDNVLKAFFPVIEKKQPVIIKTERMLDAYRAMTLQRDLGFDLILTELKEGWDITEKVKSQNAKVLLSLDLPKVEKKKEEKDEEKEEAEKADEEKGSLKSMLEEEREALEKRKAEAIKLFCSQAATFEKAGIAFGFSTLETKPDKVMSQIRVMIEHGLSEESALKALTTTPAEMLGVSSMMGTVEKGKMANIVVADKPVFEEKANIRYVFVDGHKFAYEVKTKKSKTSSEGANLNLAIGSWDYVARTPQGNQGGEIVIKNDGGTLTGTISAQGAQGATELSNVALNGNVLTFSFVFGEGTDALEVESEVTIDKDSFDGTMSVGAFGSFPVEGAKTSSPD
jgi:imidazolonepropionase-like amidohydrolase